MNFVDLKTRDDRDAFIASLGVQGIPTAVHYPLPLNPQPVFSDAGPLPGALPEAEKAAGQIVSLPKHPYLSDGEQQQVARAVADALGS